MDFEKLADHFRNSTDSLAVRDIMIITPEGDFSGHGKIRREENHIELELMLHDERELPKTGGRSYA